MEKHYSGFVQDTIEIVQDRFSLTIGSKFLHNSYSGFEAEPSARVLWTPNQRHSVWAAVTRAVRTPSRVEEDLQLTVIAAPDPHLLPSCRRSGVFVGKLGRLRTRIPQPGEAQALRGHR